MATAVREKRLERLRKICLALPEAVATEANSHVGFTVRNKTFGYYLNDHHGDGIVAITCKVAKGDNAMLAQSQPDRFYLPAYVAKNGWVGLRLDLKTVDWEEVEELVRDSYRRVAPKTLAAQVHLAAE